MTVRKRLRAGIVCLSVHDGCGECRVCTVRFERRSRLCQECGIFKRRCILRFTNGEVNRRKIGIEEYIEKEFGSLFEKSELPFPPYSGVAATLEGSSLLDSQLYFKFFDCETVYQVDDYCEQKQHS